MLCLSGFELRSRWVPLVFALLFDGNFQAQVPGELIFGGAI